ncbi:MAG: hypothetical protein QW140_02070 [Candidatus Aenigmatarchaeota archaeon]
MFFDKEKDWKECLSPEAQKIISELFEETKKHKCAYMNADDVKIAQLWCALIEIKKQFDEISKNIKKLEEPFKAIVEIGEAEKRKTIEKVVEELIKPESEEEKEATKKLVESLMKF